MHSSRRSHHKTINGNCIKYKLIYYPPCICICVCVWLTWVPYIWWIYDNTYGSCTIDYMSKHNLYSRRSRNPLRNTLPNSFLFGALESRNNYMLHHDRSVSNRTGKARETKISLIVSKVKSRFEYVSSQRHGKRERERDAIGRTVQAVHNVSDQAHILGGWSINGSDSNCLLCN